jgi:hypothetical protein
MKPTEAGTDRYSPDRASANTPPTIAKGHHGQHQQGLAHRAEGGEEQHEDQPEGDRHHHAEAGSGALLVLELAAPGHPVAGRQGHLAATAARASSTKPTRSRSAHVGLDHRIALGVFPVDLYRAIHPLDLWPRWPGAGSDRRAR